MADLRVGIGKAKKHDPQRSGPNQSMILQMCSPNWIVPVKLNISNHLGEEAQPVAWTGVRLTALAPDGVSFIIKYCLEWYVATTQVPPTYDRPVFYIRVALIPEVNVRANVVTRSSNVRYLGADVQSLKWYSFSPFQAAQVAGPSWPLHRPRQLRTDKLHSTEQSDEMIYFQAKEWVSRISQSPPNRVPNKAQKLLQTVFFGIKKFRRSAEDS